jgi:SprT protein
LEAKEVFHRFVPQASIEYCVQLYEELSFRFSIKKARKTKFGDYRYDRKTSQHHITINNDLNPYAFLITYLHEVAHLVTFEQYKHSVNPHGIEWKNNFKRLAKPMLKTAVFPSDIIQGVVGYLSNPKASSCSDPILYQLLKKYDKPNGLVFLKSLTPGDEFAFHDHSYRYIEKRRTRILCVQLGNRKKYIINQMAEVKPLSTSTPTE